MGRISHVAAMTPAMSLAAILMTAATPATTVLAAATTPVPSLAVILGTPVTPATPVAAPPPAAAGSPAPARVDVTAPSVARPAGTTTAVASAGKGHRRLLPPAGAPTGLMGTATTAGGMVLTGALLWWYGTVWPRRTLEGPIDTRRSPYGRRRHPGPKVWTRPPGRRHGTDAPET
ncbi:hypothetical protein [Streptosporangium roseum]|uniref:Uncharacterized protein n=1 Tax=Streptosporangium roseum (strain ATCC 12428 / DSM 43021 / JCM 3005 / KCTC 9067 / NCIMB 10171 / NRRL 2505 / NI 9100) TaxID=479432 RepID=D2AS21_STRRD|nr:hypothetical protein [Streptosporangium roseum]ACZ84700.1 hypothetical protein Sros_1709 [Streptosporangium roseum DSM 43021]